MFKMDIADILVLIIELSLLTRIPTAKGIIPESLKSQFNFNMSKATKRANCLLWKYGQTDWP